MAKDPNRRFRNPTLLLEQLLVVADHIGLRTNRNRAWPSPSRGEYSFVQRHLPWVVPTVLLFAIGAGLSVFWSPSSLDVPPAPNPGASNSPGPSGRSESPGVATPGEGAGALSENPTRRESPGKSPPENGSGSPGSVKAAAELPAPEGTGGGVSGEETGTRAVESATPPVPGETMLATVAVDPTSRGTPGVYRSVGEALRRAPKATTVELRFGGRAEEDSWNLTGRDVRIIAAANYRPVLSFAPQSSSVSQKESVIRVDGGRLALVDVSIELAIPRSNAVERWTMIELVNRPELSVRGGTLTIRNAADRGVPYQEDVAFLRAEESGRDVGGQGTDAAPSGSGEAFVELSNTVVRGEASLLGINNPISVSLIWNNGLLVVNRPAIVTRGIPPHSNRAQVDVEWRHVTAILGAGLWRMVDSEDRSGHVPVDVTATDCIFATSVPTPLVEQTDGKDVDELHRFFNWSGERNFYQGFETFWSIRRAGVVDPVEMWDFEQWKTYWGPEQEILPNLEGVVWKKPLPANRPFNEQTPRDYALTDDPAFKPAAATDGQDVGAILERLPEVPPGLTTPKSVQ